MSLISPGRNIVLIGLMGTGKTTVGHLLADRLQRRFVDTDQDVEHEAGATVAQLFAAEGERGFRRREAAAIRHVAALRGQVIAVGGGAVLDPSNVTHLRATGDLVLLTADPEILAERVGEGRDRPLLADADAVEALVALQAARGEAYAAAAAATVDTAGCTPDEVVDRVVAWARLQPGLLSDDEVTL